MRMETSLVTISYEGESMILTESEEASLVILGGTHNGYGFRHHQLVRAVGVQVYT